MVYGAGNPSAGNAQMYLKVGFPKVFLVFNATSAFEFRNILFSSATKMSPFTVNFLGGFVVPTPKFPLVNHQGPPVDNLSGVTVPSAGVPISRIFPYAMMKHFVPAGGATAKII